MKKYLIFAAAALIASVACTKVNLDESATPDVKIGFQVASYMTQTKADDGGFLKELEELGVTSNQAFKSIAYINADNGNGGTTLNTFFNPSSTESIAWNSTSKTWAPATKDYYWPKSPNSNLDFFSWYCYEGADPALTYDGSTASLKWQDRTVAYKSDLLYADIAFHQKANTASTSPFGKDGVTEGVPTLFHHALAQVKFAVKIKDNCDKKEDTRNPGNYTFWEVKLSDVAIAPNKVHKNGTLELTATDPDTKQTLAWTAPASPAVWANVESPASPAYVDTGNDWFTTGEAKGTKALTTTLANLIPDTFMGEGYVAVRPQSIGNDMTLGFKMTIKTYYGTDLASATAAGALTTEVINVTAYYDSSSPVAPYAATGIQLNQLGSTKITAWEMNHKYTYNIIIDPTTSTILYDPAVEAWAAEQTGSVDVPPVVTPVVTP